MLNLHISCETLQHLKEKKKKTNKNKNLVSFHHFDTSFFFASLLVNTQDNFIMAAAEIDVTFDLRFTCAANSTIEKLNVAKISKMFSLMVTVYIRG